MTSGLIGYTGFVGGNLREQREFDELYNSKNFQKMKGRNFSELVCAGISSIKWKANKEPAEDLEHIKELIDVLQTVQANRFILISTIDVYPVLNGKDETFDCHPQDNHPYGKHRLLFEDFCTQHFPNCHIIRLPALFGKNLKKNIIYDLLNDHMLEFFNPSSTFQYYYLNHIWSDIEKVVENDIPLINLFTEPVATQEILDRFFPGKQVSSHASQECHYNLLTKHSSLFDKSIPYCYSKEEVLEGMLEFIENYRKSAG